ncbi:MAG: hypothetical protein V1860_04295 [bacterium]
METTQFEINKQYCANCRLCKKILENYIDESGNIVIQPDNMAEMETFLMIFMECPSGAFEIKNRPIEDLPALAHVNRLIKSSTGCRPLKI